MITGKGSCLCGAVRYEVSGPLREVSFCHCGQCRKTSGHYVAATAAADDDLTLTEDRGLRWFASSEDASRGFCQYCGSSLFWRRNKAASTSIMAGTMDGETGLTRKRHIFVADKGDYYTLDDDLPKFDLY